VTGRPAARRVALLSIVAAAALTAVLVARTFWYLFHSVTNVPYPDQWVMLQEIWRVHTGQLGWSYLWSLYWGHRPLLPRLLILLSVKYLRYSTLPFILTNLAAQTSLVLVVVSLARRLFPNRRRLFWLSAVAAVNLLLSSLQMEVFIEGIEIQYTIGYASALAAIAIMGMALDPGLRLRPRFWVSILLGLASCACLAIGPLVWPILIVEAWLARAGIKYLAVLTAIAGIVITAYFIGYGRPSMGMGIAGFIHHPIQAFAVVALLLGGPLSFYSRALAIVSGGIGMVVAGGLAIHFWRTRSAKPAAIALTMAAGFLIGSAVALAIGRVSTDVLVGPGIPPLPSRYAAPTLAFWAVLFPVSLTCWSTGYLGRLAAMGVSVIVLALTLGTWSWQWRLSREWAMLSERYDAIGSGFLAAVSDQDYMSPIIADEQYRGRMVDYMRQRHLSVFAEPRGRWMDRDIKTIGPTDKQSNCRATVAAVPLGGDPPSFRVRGTLTLDDSIGARPPRRRLDILMTDNIGTVKGLARTLPIQSENAPAEEFWGYARGISPRELRLFVFLPGRGVCSVQIP
jgi:hypothetical protein